MVKVSRHSTPAILKKSAKSWLVNLQSAKTPDGKKRASNKYRHRDIKTALVKMFSGKCAYCESKILHVDYGHIEHFRPKGGANGDERLTFDWKNLLLACGRCNGAEHKGDSFPEPSDGGPIVNPTTENPGKHLKFVYDSLSGLSTILGRTKRGHTTEKLLGLNRADLQHHRSLFLKKLLVIDALKGKDADARKLLAEAKRTDSEYSACVCAVLR